MKKLDEEPDEDYLKKEDIIEPGEFYLKKLDSLDLD